MPHHAPIALLLLASATTVGAPVPVPQTAGADLAQVTLRERIIIRIPSAPSPVAAPLPKVVAAPPVRWKEKKGPKCIAANQLGGAVVGATDSIDLVLKGGARLRTQIDGDCAGLGYYGGFYLRPSSDGQVCAGRDSIRTRSGDTCKIKRFRTLVAKR
jgi:hypothetical protein